MNDLDNTNFIDRLLSDENISDESVYAIYQFLEDLLMEFESKAFCQLRRYNKDRQLK
jgi:hypothetical protein